MKTHLECIPCFFSQALGTARLAGADPDQQRKTLDELARMLPGFSFCVSPPEHTQHMYRSIIEITENVDPFKTIKEKSNRLALGVYDSLKDRVFAAGDPLREAVELAILGNIIDFGLRKSLDVDRELERIVSGSASGLDSRRRPIFHYREFESALRGASSVLYLGDNAGEVVFDRLLIEEIKRSYPDKRLVYAVRESPIINDALEADARECGLDRVVAIISSGSRAPGTILDQCTEEFKNLFSTVDMIISKGQGNYETLSEEGGPIFFLFMAKCTVVARHLGVSLEDIVLLDNSHNTGGS